MSDFVPGIEEAEVQIALANDTIAQLAASIPPPQGQSDCVPGIEEAERQIALAKDAIARLAASLPPLLEQRGTGHVRRRGAGKDGLPDLQAQLTYRPRARSGRVVKTRARPGGLAAGAGPAIKPPEQDRQP